MPEMDSFLHFRDWSSLRADLAWIYDGTISAAFRETNCRPDFLGAWLVESGTASVAQGGVRVTAQAGDWLILKQSAGKQEFSPEAHILSLRYRAEWPDRKPFYDFGLPLVLHAKDVPMLEEKARRLLEVVKPLAPPSPTDLRIHNIQLRDFIPVRARFLEWFGALHDALASVDVYPSRTGIHDDRVAIVLHALDRMSLSSRIREADLARMAGLSTAYFVRLFREEVGVTPKRYFDEKRRDVCRQLLSVSDVPIKEIAIDLGFLRLSNFSAWFSDSHGLSPRQFREREHQRSAGISKK